jgi:hypothetical protein
LLTTGAGSLGQSRIGIGVANSGANVGFGVCDEKLPLKAGCLKSNRSAIVACSA